MPKLKTTKNEETKRHRQAVISDRLTMLGYKGVPGLASLCGVSEGTARSRFEHPETFTVLELSRLKLSEDEAIRFLLGKLPEKKPITVYLNGIKINQ